MQKVKELSERFHTESSPLLPSGRSNSDWPLTTILDRNGDLLPGVPLGASAKPEREFRAHLTLSPHLGHYAAADL